MSDLGVFGGTVAEEMDGEELRQIVRTTAWRCGRRSAGGSACGGMPAAAHGGGRPMARPRRRDGADGAAAMRAGWPTASDGRRTAGEPAGGAAPLVAADRPHEVRRHGPLGRRADDRRQTARPRSTLDMPENLTTWQIKVWGMGHGTKVGQGADRRRHPQGPDRPPAGPAVLRAEGRGGAVGQRAQLPEDREERRRSRWNWTARRLRADASRRPRADGRDRRRRRGPRRLARQGRSTRARPSSA